jgi:hypothetical protein
VADTRTCEQCGIWFVPRREHARFCSAGCRAAWNREHTGDLKAGASALQWAITAMSETTELCVPKTSSMSWGQAIFVDRATGASPSSDAVPLKIDRFG